MFSQIKVAILTVSTSCAKGKREDASGKKLKQICRRSGFRVAAENIVCDDKVQIKKLLKHYCDKVRADVVLTTGGTGLGPHDLTPEATLEIGERIVPGISELIRARGMKMTKTSVLSRGVSVLRKKTLIINLPGSLKGSQESFLAIKKIIPHATHIIKGGGH